MASAGGELLDRNPFAANPLSGVMGGPGQVADLVTFVAGLAGSKTIERMPVQLEPLGLREGGGMGSPASPEDGGMLVSCSSARRGCPRVMGSRRERAGCPPRATRR